MDNCRPNALCKITLLISFNLSLLACGGGGSGDNTLAISSTTPAASATSVARNSAITATFNKDILAITVDASSFTLARSGNINGAVGFDGATNVATFTPDNDLAVLATYTATLSTAITDLSGKALATDYNWSFTTADGVWGSAELLETDDTVGRNVGSPQIGFDASGNAIAVWQQSNGTVNSIWANRYNAATDLWGTPVLLETDDIGGHHAYSPQIGLDASGNAIAVWYQYGGTVNSIWANRYNAATGLWGTAAAIETDNVAGHDASGPQIGLDANGNAIAVWQQSNGTVTSVWANRYNAGTGLWGTAAVIETDNTAGHNALAPQVGSDASGNAIAVWHQYDGSVYSIWANRYNAVTGFWGSAALIETDNTAGHDAGFAQIGFDASGNAIAVWRQSNGTVNSIWANRYNVGTSLWGTSVVLETDNAAGHHADIPQIGLDANGNAIAVWRQSDDTLASVWANRYNAATGLWGSAAVLETDNIPGHGADIPQIGLDASGNAIAVWQQYDGAVFSVWANRYKAATGLWGSAAVITSDNIAGHTASGPQIGLDASGSAIAVWQQTNGSVISAWANRFK